MDSTAPSYNALIARLAHWAQSEPNVRALVIFGSRARQQNPADKWSDVDMLLVAKRPRRYLTDERWLAQCGRLWLAHVDRAPVGGVEEHRAVFEGALELDFVVMSDRDLRLVRLGLKLIARFPAALHLLPRGLRLRLAAISETFGHGVRSLVDKDGLMTRLPIVLDAPQSSTPSAEEFRAFSDRFWHGSIWVAKHLRRGELWRAKEGCDVRMKASILRLAEWHAKANKGWNLCTWAEGRFIERWADPRVVAALHGAFAHYETEDVWRALFASMELFDWLARETVAKLGVSYQSLGADHAREWVRSCFSEWEAMRMESAAQSTTAPRSKSAERSPRCDAEPPAVVPGSISN